MSQNNFVGREHEKKRLTAFLNNPEGGSVLVAGRRGSGKTTLLKTVLSARSKHGTLLRRYMRYTHNKTVHVHIPLIIVNKNQVSEEKREQAEIYRSLILRSIVFALLTHLNKRQYKNFALPVRYFLSMGLVREIKKLKKYVEFNSLEQQNKSGFGVSYKNLDLSKQFGHVGSIDLSDSKIEMLLYDIFESFGQQTEFVFVFDEMDKLEGTVPIQEVVLYLKNLFSDTGVHAIFVCNENQGYEALKHKDSADDNKYATLFRETIIIKGVDPLELRELVESRLSGERTKLLAVAAGIAVLTDNYPLRINDVLNKNDHDLDRLFEYISEEIGGSADGYRTAGRLFVDAVYARYKKKHNSDYNHMLYRVLCEISDIIVEQKTKFININDVSTIIYTTDLFNNDKEREKQYKIDTTLATRQGYAPNAIPELIKNIETVNYHYNQAIGSLITLYERTNWLSLNAVPGSSNLIQLEAFHGDTFNIQNINLDFDSTYSLTKDELKLQKIAQKYIEPFRAFSEKSDYWSEKAIQLSPFEGYGGEQATYVDLYGIKNTKLSWKLISPAIDAAESYVLQAFIKKLNIDSSLQDLRIDNVSATFQVNSKNVKLVFEFPEDSITKDNSYDKTIILRAPSVDRQKLHGKIKYFEFDDWEDSVESKLINITNYINSL